MKLAKFCENRYQELTLESQSEDAYDCVKDAEIKAVHQILSSYRVLLKWALIPKCLYDYTRVCMGLDSEPKAVILEKFKAEKPDPVEMSEP